MTEGLPEGIMKYARSEVELSGKTPEASPSVELRARLAELISQASSGAIPVSEALGGGSLRALGLDSLSALRLIDAIDLEFGVEIDIGGSLGPDTLDDVVATIEDRTP